MRSSKKSNQKSNIAGAAGGPDQTSFGDAQSSREFHRHNDFTTSSGLPGDNEPNQPTVTSPLPYTFLLLQERYLEDLDTRCIIQFDEEKFVACVWGQAEIFVIDREKPDAVNSFETGGSQPPCKQNLSI